MYKLFYFCPSLAPFTDCSYLINIEYLIGFHEGIAPKSAFFSSFRYIFPHFKEFFPLIFHISVVI